MIDLETAPRDGDPPECPESFLNKGIKDNFKPETVERYQQENREKWVNEEWKRVASLDWRYGQIVAAGLLYAEDDVIDVNLWLQGEFDSVDFGGLIPTVQVGMPEYDILDEISATINRDVRLAGFIHRNFDIPWIQGRAMVNGVPMKLPFASRYDPTRITDWADILANYGGFDRSGWTLEKYAELFDLEVKPWGEGKSVGEWHTNGEHDKIAKHLLSDLLTTYHLDRRCAPAYGLA